MPFKATESSSKPPQDSRALSPSKKIFRLSFLWMILGVATLGLGVSFAMQSFSSSQTFITNAQDSIQNTSAIQQGLHSSLAWMPLLASLLSPELAVLASLLIWMALGFLITRFLWMPLAKALVLLMMHQRPNRRLFTALLIAPIAFGMATLLLPWVDCAYALGIMGGLSFFNGGFIFLKFSQALKAHMPKG